MMMHTLLDTCCDMLRWCSTILYHIPICHGILLCTMMCTYYMVMMSAHARYMSWLDMMMHTLLDTCLDLIWWCTLFLTHAMICCGDALLYFIIYLYAMVFFYALWWCTPCVQHKQRRFTCSVIVYDERYMSSMWQWYLQQIQRLDWHRLPYEKLFWLRLAKLYKQLVWFRWIKFGVQTQIDSVGWSIGTAKLDRLPV